jgi:hypothetical protein
MSVGASSAKRSSRPSGIAPSNNASAASARPRRPGSAASCQKSRQPRCTCSNGVVCGDHGRHPPASHQRGLALGTALHRHQQGNRIQTAAQSGQQARRDVGRAAKQHGPDVGFGQGAADEAEFPGKVAVLRFDEQDRGAQMRLRRVRHGVQGPLSVEHASQPPQQLRTACLPDEPVPLRQAQRLQLVRSAQRLGEQIERHHGARARSDAKPPSIATTSSRPE